MEGISLSQAIGTEELSRIQDSYMKYLESSSSIIDVNGDYVVTLRTSGWCRLLNRASRRLCGDCPDEEAVNSGKWICHEDCRAAGRKAITEKKPVEMECPGGIVIHAALIMAEGKAVGAINAGISNPPTDEERVGAIAAKFEVSTQELLDIAKEYTPRPQSVFEAAKNHIQTAADMIANIFVHKRTADELKRVNALSEKSQSESDERQHLIETLTESMSEVFWIADYVKGQTLYLSPSYEVVWGRSRQSAYGKNRSFFESIHPEDRAMMLADLEIKKKGLSYTREFRIVRPDGSVRWIQSKAFPDKNRGATVYAGIAEDITERKHMETELVEERNKFKSIVKAIDYGITIQDTEFNIIYQGETIKAICGSTLGEKCYKVYESKESVCQGCPVEMAYKDGQRHSSIRKILNPEGRFTVVASTANPIRDADGAIVACLELTRDITEDHMASERVQESEEKYRKLFESAGDAVLNVSLDGLILDLNRKAERLFGMRKDKLVGRSLSDFTSELVSGKDKERVKHEFRNSVATGSGLLFNVELNTPDASGIYVDINATVVQYGRKKLLQATLRDISRKVELERCIAAELAMRKAVEKCVAAGIAAVDLQWRLIYANPSFCKMVGFSEEELIGSLPPFPYWTPEDMSNITAGLKANLLGNLRPEGHDVIFKRKNGERINVNIRGAKLVNSDGVMIGVIGSMNDITLGKKMEYALKRQSDELNQLNHNLQELVFAKVGELRRKDQLLIQQSKMASMGEMLTAIAHQWGQPLNALGLIVQDMKDAYKFGEFNSAYIDATVNKAMHQLGFMSTSIDVFRNFFKVSKDKQTFNVLSSCADVFSMLAPQLKHTSISYSITCHTHNRTYLNYADVVACDDVVITAYKNHLAHVLLNLITNAKDAIVYRRGLGLSTAEGMIAVDCFREGGTLRIEIRDNGGGISQEAMSHLFDQYFTTRSDKGTGIGLYMSKVIVEESLGGKIYASNKGDGAVFTVELYLPSLN